MRSNAHAPAEIHFNINNIQTLTFPVSTPFFTLKDRRFYVSASDGRITKKTMPIKIDGRPLGWNESLDGFTLDSSSQVTIKIFEKRMVFPEELLATFFLPYEILCCSQTDFVLESAGYTSKEKNSPQRTICIVLSKHESEALPTANIIDDLVPGPSSMVDRIQHSRIHVKEARRLSGQMRIASGLVTGDRAFTSVKGFLDKWEIVRDKLRFVVAAVNTISEVHPYAKLAWGVISYIPTIISEQIQLDHAILDLLDAIEVALDLAPDPDALRLRCQKSSKHERTLARLLEQINECGHFIQSYLKDVDFWHRFVKNFINDGTTVVDNYLRILKNLRDDFVSEAIVTVENNVYRILAEVETMRDNIKDIELNLKLQKLPYGIGTGFDPLRGCLLATRVKFLESIIDWVNNPDPSSPQVLMLFGQAGTGKSCIAHEVASRFLRLDRLTTFYRFVQGKPSSRECYRFFTTLAVNLCKKYPRFQTALGGLINNNREVVEAQAYATLFESLLRSPLTGLHFVGPIFIIIDALDESEDASDRRLRDTLPFHHFLAKHLPELPSNFRLLITSRPEAEILDAFPKSSSVCHMRMDDSDLSDGVEDDIRTYMRTKLTTTRIGEGDLQKLAEKAEGLFQWAHVASDYIANPPPGLDSKYCLQNILSSSQPNEAADRLDILYSTVLEARFDMNHGEIRKNFQSVMAHVLGTFEPLSITSLNTMRQHAAGGGPKPNDIDVSNVVKYMGSLLSNVTPSYSTRPISPLHTSFRDFLTNKKRSGKFHVDIDNAQDQLAYATLQTMRALLHFNMCGLETSYHLNSEVVDLGDRIEKYIHPALLYSCRFWSKHLARVVNFNADLFQSLSTLVEQKFLFWLEVLSVGGELPIAMSALLALSTWCKLCDKKETDTLDTLVKDAMAFVRYFGIPIAHSVPHIYISALPFAPSSSAISKLYGPRFPRTLGIVKGRLSQWPPLVQTISVPGLRRPGERNVVCVAFSRNGENIAAGMGDGATYVWSDASTGIRLCGSFKTGAKFISSVGFSPDGRYLASGLSDGKICMWEVPSLQEVIVRLKVHTGSVSSLSFSKDSTQLVSGSSDGTVKILDLEKGEAVAGPSSGHNNPVWAVSFLPDQKHVVSRSGFRTVQVWNVKTGQTTQPFDIPTGSIGTIITQCKDQFLIDQSHVSHFAVCSWEKATKGEEELFKHYEHWYPAAVFSPNGKFIATSCTYQIDIWHAVGELAGNRAGGPFSSYWVTSLAFSADSRLLVSGSYTGIVRVWTVGIAEELASMSLKVPWSVAFTPNGRQLAVGWRDGVIQMLDASTGQEVTRLKEMDGTGDGFVEVAVSLTKSGDWIQVASALERRHEVQVWTLVGESVTASSPVRLRSSDNTSIFTVVFSPDSDNLVAFGTKGGTVYVLDTSTSALVVGPRDICQGQDVTSLAVSSLTDSSDAMTTQLRVAVGTYKEAFVWDIQTGEVKGPFTHHGNWVWALVFSADGRYLTSVAEDYTLCVWGSVDGKIVRGPVGFGDQKVYSGDLRRWSIALSHTGQRVAFVGKHHMVQVFDVLYEGESELALQGPLVLGGHVAHVNGLAFSMDGRRLVTTSNDHTIRIWNIPTAMDRKVLINTASEDTEVTYFSDDTFFDSDGWAICQSNRSGPLRLIWVPELHRATISRPSSQFVVIPKDILQLDLGSFVRGKDWTKCKA